MIRKLLIVLIAFFAIQLNAQQGTSSPYSFYGIGTLKFKGTVENKSMGGLSIYTDSIHVNLRNPAGLVGPNIKSFNEESRPVKFSVAGSVNNVNLVTESDNFKTNASTFDYLTLEFPVGRFGVGFGLLPFTSVGYKLESIENDLIQNRYRGEGGLNKTFLGLGYLINNDLSVGVYASYNFGNTQNSVIEFLYDEENNPLQYQTREDNRSDLSGLSFNFGLSYKKMINDKFEIVTGFTYAPESTLKSNNTRSLSTITIGSSGQEFVINNLEVDLEAENLKSTDLILPSRVSIGAGIGQPRIWFIGAEYTYLNSKKFSNPIFSADNTTFVNASGIALGGFFIPDYNSFSNYWKRATYRAGLHFENTGLEINNETINEFGISFGVGLPVGNIFSNANLGFEIGKRGTTNQNLVQENFFNVNISLSLNDRWFQKRKYN